MKDQGNEHSIMATFTDSQDARKALVALKNAGITNVTLDKINRFSIETSQDATQNVEKTIDSATKVLMASDPSISEYGLERHGVGEEEGYLLNIVAGTSKLNQALKIVEKYGGEI